MLYKPRKRSGHVEICMVLWLVLGRPKAMRACLTNIRKPQTDSVDILAEVFDSVGSGAEVQCH